MNGGLLPEEECFTRRLTNVIGEAIVRFPKLGSVWEVKVYRNPLARRSLRSPPLGPCAP
jgi:hypothetical protein